jgi:hypothetical protein
MFCSNFMGLLKSCKVNCEVAGHMKLKAVAAKGNVPEGTSRNNDAHLKFLIVLRAATTDHCAARRDVWPRQLREDGNSQNRSFCLLA